jgi:uncharacterized protein with HEPN domain
MGKGREHRVYVHDIRSAIARIGEYSVEGKSRFLGDTKTQDAILYQLAIIGEAAAKLPRSMREAHPRIPWKAIIGMRNIIIHEYSGISMELVWATIRKDLPKLAMALARIVKADAA